ncbi:hypothetical protein KUCAC02_007986, partial [Chaenocephalus aceratus]
MESIKDRTRGIDMCDAVCRSLDAYNVELTSMVGVTTDGAPAMVGRKAGAVSLLSDKVANNGVTTRSHSTYSKIPSHVHPKKSLQVDELDLQESSEARAAYRDKNLIEFYKGLSPSA